MVQKFIWLWYFSLPRVSSVPTYYVPKDGPLSSYKEYVSMLPNVDPPEAFGQHPNADIQSQIQETRMLFNTLLSLQPQISAASGGESREDKVCATLTICVWWKVARIRSGSDLNSVCSQFWVYISLRKIYKFELQYTSMLCRLTVWHVFLIAPCVLLQVLDLSANIFKQIPENIDYDNTAKILSVDPSPLNVVLLQEVGVTHVCLSVCLTVYLSVCQSICVSLLL